mmetsp:Transcript_24406/g.50746  ORF Transcript_24406/g.50746 Transcript_24406/m.50746 type:complete len:206 (+) Transcript_24406:123-740(+)
MHPQALLGVLARAAPGPDARPSVRNTGLSEPPRWKLMGVDKIGVRQTKYEQGITTAFEQKRNGTCSEAGVCIEIPRPSQIEILGCQNLKPRLSPDGPLLRGDSVPVPRRQVDGTASSEPHRKRLVVLLLAHPGSGAAPGAQQQADAGRGSAQGQQRESGRLGATAATEALRPVEANCWRVPGHSRQGCPREGVHRPRGCLTEERH